MVQGMAVFSPLFITGFGRLAPGWAHYACQQPERDLGQIGLPGKIGQLQAVRARNPALLDLTNRGAG